MWLVVCLSSFFSSCAVVISMVSLIGDVDIQVFNVKGYKFMFIVNFKFYQIISQVC